jgi:hypothetical protein
VVKRKTVLGYEFFSERGLNAFSFLSVLTFTHLFLILHYSVFTFGGNVPLVLTSCYLVVKSRVTVMHSGPVAIYSQAGSRRAGLSLFFR